MINFEGGLGYIKILRCHKCINKSSARCAGKKCYSSVIEYLNPVTLEYLTFGQSLITPWIYPHIRYVDRNSRLACYLNERYLMLSDLNQSWNPYYHILVNQEWVV